MSTLQEQIAAAEQWFSGPRFAHVVRLYSPRQVAEQQGSLPHQYPIAASAAEAFHARLRELFEQRRAITTFGPYSPGQAVTMKRLGIEGIYLGGWATSAKGSITRIPARTSRAIR
jgi:isocitrate lyase